MIKLTPTQSENLDAVVSAISDLMDEKVRYERERDNNYYGGQVYDAEKVLRAKLLNLMGWEK